MAGLAKAGSEAMMKALKHNRTLRELDISFNRIPVEGAAFLANGLKENDVLQYLKVNFCFLIVSHRNVVKNVFHNNV